MDRLRLQRGIRLLGAVVNRLTGHGGNIYRAAREQHRRPLDLCDFSASINPLGPPPSVLRTLRRELWVIRHYPDPDCYELRFAFSKQFGLPPDWFLVGNGSAELIDLLPFGLGVAQALVVGPTFSEYEAAIQRAGAACVYCFAERKEDYRPPINLIPQLCQEQNIELVFLCNPNSPTGHVIARKDMLSLLDALNHLGRWLVLDEAFVEFAPEESVLDVLCEYPRLVILRSCTKFFAIPGLRLGYLVGRPTVLEQVRRRQVPWSVNAPAQLAAVAALQDVDYRKRSVRYIAKERPRLVSNLQAIPGLHVFPSSANFLLLELPRSISAAVMTDRLRQTGMLIRDCSNVPGLNERTIRIAVRRRRDNDRLCCALETLLRDGASVSG